MSTIDDLERLASELSATDLDGDERLVTVSRIHAVVWQLIEVAGVLTQSEIEHVTVPMLVEHGYPQFAGLLMSAPTDSDEVH